MAIAFNKPLVCPVMIGRAQDLTTLRLLVERAKSGQGQVALLSGEAATSGVHHLPSDATSGRTPNQRAWGLWFPRSSRGAANPGHAAEGFQLSQLNQLGRSMSFVFPRLSCSTAIRCTFFNWRIPCSIPPGSGVPDPTTWTI